MPGDGSALMSEGLSGEGKLVQKKEKIIRKRKM